MLEKAKCVKCGWVWVKRIDKPLYCPHCHNKGIDKSYKYKIAGHQESLKFKKKKGTK